IDILIYDTKIGVISAYQEGANCHKLNLLSKTYFVGKNKIIEGNYKAVAGGCFMMRAFEFEKIKGYTVSDIYSGDDASIMKKCHHILKKKAVVCETVALQHMLNEENENAYQAWKIAKARGEIPQGENTKGFYDI
ncbi:MAG: hypothetical protein KDD94_06910, partial [Calditrichaeota bacterium]|nr:hypothetical protein [Calditrichota bacterium]